MNDREKLIELLSEGYLTAIQRNLSVMETQARILLAHGVTIAADKNDGCKWMPVTERLPEEGEDVLVFGYWHERYQPLKCHLSPHYKGRWFTSVAGQEVYAVTHWMPLPEPPKGD